MRITASRERLFTFRRLGTRRFRHCCPKSAFSPLVTFWPSCKESLIETGVFVAERYALRVWARSQVRVELEAVNYAATKTRTMRPYLLSFGGVSGRQRCARSNIGYL